MIMNYISFYLFIYFHSNKIGCWQTHSYIYILNILYVYFRWLFNKKRSPITFITVFFLHTCAFLGDSSIIDSDKTLKPSTTPKDIKKHTIVKVNQFATLLAETLTSGPLNIILPIIKKN